MELRKRTEIEAFLTSPGAVRAALLHGPDLGLVRARGAHLAAAASERPDDPFDTARLTEADLANTPARLEEELAAFSLLGGRRVVRLRLAAERGRAEEIALEAFRRHIAGDFNTACLLIVEAAELRKGGALRAAAEKSERAVAIACYPEEAGDLSRLVRQKLSQDRLALDADALRRFTSRLPGDHGVAIAEIERLALFLGPGSGRTGTDADLDSFLGVEPAASLGQAAYDAFGGRAAAAFAGLRRAEREGEGGSAAIRALSVHLSRLGRAADDRLAGRSLADAVQAAQIFWKSREEFTRQARVWGRRELDPVRDQVFAAEEGSRRTSAPAALMAERLSLSIAARARHLGL